LLPQWTQGLLPHICLVSVCIYVFADSQNPTLRLWSNWELWSCCDVVEFGRAASGLQPRVPPVFSHEFSHHFHKKMCHYNLDISINFAISSNLLINISTIYVQESIFKKVIHTLHQLFFVITVRLSRNSIHFAIPFNLLIDNQTIFLNFWWIFSSISLFNKFQIWIGVYSILHSSVDRNYNLLLIWSILSGSFFLTMLVRSSGRAATARQALRRRTPPWLVGCSTRVVHWFSWVCATQDPRKKKIT